MTQPARRPPTELDDLAEQWLATQIELRPEMRVRLGVDGDHSQYTDYSPEGAEARADAARTFSRRLRETVTSDPVDEATQAELARVIDLEIALHDADSWQRDLNVIESPAQTIREIFDSMSTDGPQAWETINRRLAALPAAIDGYMASLRCGIAAGRPPSARQVAAVSIQAARLSDRGAYFDELAARAQGPSTLVASLQRTAQGAASAYGRLSQFLRTALLPNSRSEDAVGRDEYTLSARGHFGIEADLDETYDWGLDELRRITQQQERVASTISDGGSVEDALTVMSRDPSLLIEGTDKLQAWMQERSDEAIDKLGAAHFDIPDELRRLECRIAPTRGGGIYYTEPSDDFARPGRMWWSPSEDVSTFATWRELTTVYHEGVPGHHLQCGLAIHNRGELNSWRRNNWNSGHGEGWALYAEKLMAELGHLSRPAEEFGMLTMQRLRAARVVIDIGVHLRKPGPDGSDPWTAGTALAFLQANADIDEQFARFEIDRYLGWPGQAPSYKIGQRQWERLRRSWEAEGRGSIKDFHHAALRVGSVGLGTLERVLLTQVRDGSPARRPGELGPPSPSSSPLSPSPARAARGTAPAW